MPTNPAKKMVCPCGLRCKLAIIAVVVLTLALFFWVCFLYMSSYIRTYSWNEMSITGPLFQRSTSRSVEGKALYFGMEREGTSALVDIRAGNTKEFLPSGYTIPNKMDYKMFAPYLIVQKDDGLYSYDVQSKAMTSIFQSSPDLKLKKNERPWVYPSITEKDKFIIRVDAMGDTIVDEMGDMPEVLSTRTYSYDATNGTLATLKNKQFESCTTYDSLNQRLFTWLCGEGVGSATPLSVRDLSDLRGKTQKDVVTASDVGLGSQDRARVDYEAGLFMITGRGDNFQIMVVDPKEKAISKEVFTATPAVADKVKDLSPYSMVIDRATHTFAVGGDNYIALLSFDDNHQITKATFLLDDAIYANFIFVNAGKLYYAANGKIRVVDIVKQKIERTISAPDRLSEVTLFFL